MKKIILSLMLLLPLNMIAQEIKIAIVNTNDVLTVMPELTAMENQMMELVQRYQSELQAMDNEYNKKYSEFLDQQETLTENIRAMRVRDLEDTQERMRNLYQVGEQERDQLQEKLFEPIQEKMQNAIDAVSEENNFTIVFQAYPQLVLYTGKAVIDATDLVKAKLGIR